MSDSGSELRSRRALLTGGIGGLAALIAGAVLRPLPAEAAAGGSVILGAINSSDAALTRVTSTSGTSTLSVVNDTTGNALRADSWQGPAVNAYSHYSTAALAEARSADQISVHGLKVNGTGPAVKGENKFSTNGYAAVYGVTNGTGPAVYGEGTAQGNGTSGVARGTGSGVYGQSDNGRGGRFSGKKAQLKLDPSAAATHPASGDAGDIFLDKSKRLWLCKGGTSWVRLDL